MSPNGPGSSRARSDRLGRSFRFFSRLAPAGLIAVACLGIGAPVAWADETAGAPSSEAPIQSPPTDAHSELTQSAADPTLQAPPESPAPADAQPALEEQPPSPSVTDEGADSGIRPPDSASGNTGSTAGGGDHSSGATEQETTALPAASNSLVTPNIASSPLVTPGPLATANLPTVVPIATGGADVDAFAGMVTGGSRLLLASSLLCGALACSQGPAGLFSPSASVNELQKHHDVTAASSKASEPPSTPLPGGPGQVPRPSFGLPGPGGGSGLAFVLLSLMAVLATPLARACWTTGLRLPTATWRPSAYVPPIESPG